jgi:hypothetical protein
MFTIVVTLQELYALNKYGWLTKISSGRKFIYATYFIEFSNNRQTCGMEGNWENRSALFLDIN